MHHWWIAPIFSVLRRWTPQTAGRWPQRSARVAREAAGVSINAFKEAITRAETTGLVARETAEESFRKYEEALVQDQVIESVPEPEIPMVPREVEEKVKENDAMSAPKTDSDVQAEGEKKVAKSEDKKTAVNPEVKGKMQARLESLAKMYETKEITNNDSQSEDSDNEEES